MAKGTESKNIITQKILEVFEGAFLYNEGKEIRIPLQEDNEEIQIKITLTTAKTNVEHGDMPTPKAGAVGQSYDSTPNKFMQQPNDEEKAKVEELLARLNIK